MQRQQITQTIGAKYMTANIEEDEWSYAKDAGTLGDLLTKLGLGEKPDGFHYKLDRRFYLQDDTGQYSVLVETKQNFVDTDVEQLSQYVDEEYALHKGVRVIAILANTNNDRIRVWKSQISDDCLLHEETKLDTMEHYASLFVSETSNNRLEVMHNTYELNELLHKRDIEERLRSQFVGTVLLYVKDEVVKHGQGGYVGEKMRNTLINRWKNFSSKQICSGIGEVLDNLLDGTKNKTKKIELLKRDVLENQHVKNLSDAEWLEILEFVLMKIYRYIDADSSEGQDILNLFFITFNKYVGKADKNQAFTPDHITDFMARVTDITYVDTAHRALGCCKVTRFWDVCCSVRVRLPISIGENAALVNTA